jgi:molecular chaperone HtpG
MSGYLQRMFKQAGQVAPIKLPILELNPEHALVKKIKDLNSDVPHLSG